MPTTIILGISGPSSSGKTTLARLLCQVLLEGGHKTFILHEDDFYVADKEIPLHKETGYQDWDCLASIDLKAFENALRHIKAHGRLPADLQSKEDQNIAGHVTINGDVLNEIKEQAKSLSSSLETTIAIVDGFLLFTPALKPVYTIMDIRMFLPVTRQLMIARRAARSGYVTLEGFWEDPPGYVEKVVWANYAKDHAFLFQNGDVEGKLELERVRDLQLNVAPKETMEDMTSCLRWAWQILQQSLQ